MVDPLVSPAREFATEHPGVFPYAAQRNDGETKALGLTCCIHADGAPSPWISRVDSHSTLENTRRNLADVSRADRIVAEHTVVLLERWSEIWES
jgi:hypothetical protein